MDFGDLRSISHNPRLGNWYRLCRGLDLLDEGSRQYHAKQSYIEHVLESWPDALRPVPKRWLSDLAEAKPSPAAAGLAMAGALRLEGPAQLSSALLRHEALRHIRRLSLSGRRSYAVVLRNLASSAQFQGLRALAIDDLESDVATLSQLIASSTMRELTDLALAFREPAPRELAEVIARWPGLCGLERLTLRQVKPDLQVSLQILAQLRGSALRELTLDAGPMRADEFGELVANLPELRTLSVRSLELHEATLRRLADATQLETMTLRGVRLDARATAALGRLRVRHLRVEDSQLDFGAIDEASFPALRELHIERCSVDNARALAEIASWHKLEALSLGAIAEAEIMALLCASLGDEVRFLSLNLYGLRPQWAGALGQRPNLEELHLRLGALDDRGIATLIDVGQMLSLRSVSLHHVGLGAYGLAALANSSAQGSLRELSIEGCMAVHSLTQLLEARRFRGLRDLSVVTSQLRADHLERCLPSCAGLERLSLRGNDIGNRGAQLLAEAEGTESLHALDLRATGFGDSGLRALGQAEGLRFLEDAQLGDNAFSGEAVAELELNSSWPLLLRHKLWDWSYVNVWV